MTWVRCFKCAVAGLVSERVVQLLEVVDVEQGDADGRLAAVGTLDFAFYGFVQAAPVECAGQLVFPHQFADLFQFVFQFLDAGFGLVGLLLVGEQFFVRTHGAGLDDARVVHHVFQDVAEFGQVVGLADLLAVAFDLVVIFTRAFGQVTQAVDEGGHQALQGCLGIGQALFERALLDDDIAQIALGIGDGTLVHRFVDDRPEVQ